MSKVQLQGNVSGTGIFTIASPNSNTDRTLTLPDNTGTLLSSASTVATSQLPSQLSINSGAPAGSFSIDSAGRGRIPNQPGFGGYVAQVRTSDGTFTNYGTFISNFNTGSGFNATTGRFTAPIGGIYLVAATVKSDNNSTTTRGLMRLFVNGVQYDEIAETYGPFQDVGSAQILALSANDFIYLTIEGAAPSTPYRALFNAMLLS